MKSGIHPKYETAKITCACGRVTETRTTVGEIHVEICSHCHPFFTGRQKLVDTAGRVERFKAKYGSSAAVPDTADEPSAPAEASAEETGSEETAAAEIADTPEPAAADEAEEVVAEAPADEAPPADDAAEETEDDAGDEKEASA